MSCLPPSPSSPLPPLGWPLLRAWPRAWGVALAGTRSKLSARAGGEDPSSRLCPLNMNPKLRLNWVSPLWVEGPSSQHTPKPHGAQCFWSGERIAQVGSGMRSRTGLRPGLELPVSPSPSHGEVCSRRDVGRPCPATIALHLLEMERTLSQLLASIHHSSLLICKDPG